MRRIGIVAPISGSSLSPAAAWRPSTAAAIHCARGHWC
jgi:hypothetical protein